jgi:hypothetical protein
VVDPLVGGAEAVREHASARVVALRLAERARVVAGLYLGRVPGHLRRLDRVDAAAPGERANERRRSCGVTLPSPRVACCLGDAALRDVPLRRSEQRLGALEVRELRRGSLDGGVREHRR